MRIVTAGVIVGLVGLAYWYFVGVFCNAMKTDAPLPPPVVKKTAVKTAVKTAKKTAVKTEVNTVKKMKSKKAR